VQGDITQLKAGAIVNAANSSLLPGGGVCGAIHRAGGPAIAEACRAIGHCAEGEVVITTGGRLNAKYIIHAVGPVWQGGNHHEDQLLASAYRNSLLRAAEHQLSSIVFPNISTGIFGYPKERAAAIAVHTVQRFLEQHSVPAEVIFCCYDSDNYDLYRKLLNN
jgi:O-acetyl-ADP-ribose deacetylase (regulator of RNase III)